MEVPGTVIFDRVILTEVSNIAKMSGKIHIPDNAEMVQTGIIYKMGTECNKYLESGQRGLCIGDRVVLEKSVPVEMTISGVKYHVVRYKDIMFNLTED